MAKANPGSSNGSGGEAIEAVPSSGAPAVASELLAYCTSCRMDLNHIVVAMKGDRVAKVECQTCKKIHVYKTPKGITTPDTTKKKRGAKASKGVDDAAQNATSITAEWEKLMSLHREAPRKTYNTKASFALGDKLDHPTFGEGIVGKLIFPNKLEVVFKANIKILIHGGAQT